MQRSDLAPSPLLLALAMSAATLALGGCQKADDTAAEPLATQSAPADVTADTSHQNAEDDAARGADVRASNAATDPAEAAT